jgi:hypothetical protein
MFTPQYGFEGAFTALEWLEELGDTGIKGLIPEDYQNLKEVGIIKSDNTLDKAKLHLLQRQTIVPDAVVENLATEPTIVDLGLFRKHAKPLPAEFGHGPDHPLWRK